MHLPHSDGSLGKNIPVWLRKCFDHGRVFFERINEHFSSNRSSFWTRWENVLPVKRFVSIRFDYAQLQCAATEFSRAAHWRTMVTIRLWSTRFAPPRTPASVSSKRTALRYFGSWSSARVHHEKIVQEDTYETPDSGVQSIARNLWQFEIAQCCFAWSVQSGDAFVGSTTQTVRRYLSRTPIDALRTAPRTLLNSKFFQTPRIELTQNLLG